MSPWDGASRWINTLLLVIVGFVGFDTLFELLEANDRNVIVGFTRAVAGVLLTPFEGMFDEQDYLLTALIAVLGYALVAGIAMAVLRSIQASRRRSGAAQAPIAEHPQAGDPSMTQPLPEAHRPDAWGGATGWQRHVPQQQDGTARERAPHNGQEQASDSAAASQRPDAQTDRLPSPDATGAGGGSARDQSRNGGVHRS